MDPVWLQGSLGESGRRIRFRRGDVTIKVEVAMCPPGKESGQQLEVQKGKEMDSVASKGMRPVTLWL